MGGAAVRALHARARGVRAERSQQQLALAARRAALCSAERVLFPRIKRLIGPNLEFLVCGSAPLGEETQRWFQMIGIPVYQVYGLTETHRDRHHRRHQRARHARPRRSRARRAASSSVSDEGELLCRGPNVFRGYWNRPDATAAVLRDGWFCTPATRPSSTRAAT